MLVIKKETQPNKVFIKKFMHNLTNYWIASVCQAGELCHISEQCVSANPLRQSNFAALSPCFKHLLEM